MHSIEAALLFKSTRALCMLAHRKLPLEESICQDGGCALTGMHTGTCLSGSLGTERYVIQYLMS